MANLRHIKEILAQRKVRQALDNITTFASTFEGDQTVIQALTLLEIVYPVGYTFNNTPEFYDQLKTRVESGKPFHFLFVGVTGSGKTYLANLIMDMMKKHHQWETLQKINCSEFYEHYLNSLNNREINSVREYSPNNKFLLDDLGAEKLTDNAKWFYSNFIDINYRMIKAGACKYSIITTNLTSEPLTVRYGSRTMDRLLEHYTIFNFAKHSFRRQNVEVIKGDKQLQQEIKV